MVQENTVMPNLEDYYRDLLIWEGQSARQLVHVWPVELQTAIESSFVAAVSTSSIKGSDCPIRPGSTNQSIGNQVESYSISKLAAVISGFSILPCSGAGYPDKTLVRLVPELRMPLEVKATSNWNPKDSNRRVLTSSSKKLRTQFHDPMYHLLLTLIYCPSDSFATIEAIRLDFLEPTTTVSVRLEASVNHKILANSTHHNILV